MSVRTEKERADMTIQKIIAAAAAAVVGVTGSALGFRGWHNSQMEKQRQELSDQFEIEERRRREEEEKRRETEDALARMEKKYKDETGKNLNLIKDRDSWKYKFDQKVKEFDQYIFDHEVVLDTEEIKNEILEINELAVVAYIYRNAGAINDHKTINIPIIKKDAQVPLTGKQCVITMDGIIKAGIDASKVTIENNEEAKTLIISLPETKILSNELQEDSICVYSDEASILNKLTAEDHNELRKKIKDGARKTAIDNGVLKQADERVRLLIRNMLGQIPNFNEKYKIEFKTIE